MWEHWVQTYLHGSGKGCIIRWRVGQGIARAHCSYCLNDMSVQVGVGTVLRSLLPCTLLMYKPSCIFTLHTLNSWVVNEQAKSSTSTEQLVFMCICIRNTSSTAWRGGGGMGAGNLCSVLEIRSVAGLTGYKFSQNYTAFWGGRGGSVWEERNMTISVLLLYVCCVNYVQYWLS